MLSGQLNTVRVRVPTDRTNRNDASYDLVSCIGTRLTATGHRDRVQRHDTSDRSKRLDIGPIFDQDARAPLFAGGRLSPPADLPLKISSMAR